MTYRFLRLFTLLAFILTFLETADECLHNRSFSPHNVDIGVATNDGVELEARPDGEREPKLRQHVHVELVALLVGGQALHRVCRTGNN